jgi:hypothetical protein
MTRDSSGIARTSGRAGDEATPEALMNSFKGVSAGKMVAVTLVFHVLMIGLFSVSYLKRTFLGQDVSKLTREQRLDKAMTDATSSLRKIAEANGLNPQDISDRLSPGGARTSRAAAAAPAEESQGRAPAATNAPQAPPAGAPAAAGQRPESVIEKDLKKAVKGPQIPDAGGKDDIF